MASIAFPKLVKKATLNDGTTYGYIYVPAASNKPTFLLLHGAPSSSYIWHHQIELLPKAGFGVFAPDLLGYGDTDKPESYEPYQMKCLVPQVYELISMVLSIHKVIGVGHDFGAGLLSHLYVHHKELFSQLVFIATGFMFLDSPFDPDLIIQLSKKLVGYSTRVRSNYTEIHIEIEL
ncbi:Alpha/Beta hydrolase protein [Triangularia setosa]|uniref:Alpha/Beta hydrolase protein n=1 Tax=Triangularia setosa TaxID=2587417 RepID=A0AAN6VWP9_9PEZI|nr:Alpha/Beta hydrolase protein [Podospora setosa]